MYRNKAILAGPPAGAVQTIQITPNTSQRSQDEINPARARD